MLHGQWKFAISEIQFPCSFLHVRYNENVRFVDVKPDKGTNVYLRQKKLHFQMEFKTVSVGDLAACTIDLWCHGHAITVQAFPAMIASRVLVKKNEIFPAFQILFKQTSNAGKRVLQ